MDIAIYNNPDYWREKHDFSDLGDEYIDLHTVDELLSFILDKYIRNLKELCLYHAGLLDDKIYRFVFQQIHSFPSTNNWRDNDHIYYIVSSIIYCSIEMKSKLGSIWNRKDGSFYM
jgi:hypothetical protein